jgi:hypothetical protein
MSLGKMTTPLLSTCCKIRRELEKLEVIVMAFGAQCCPPHGATFSGLLVGNLAERHWMACKVHDRGQDTGWLPEFGNIHCKKKKCCQIGLLDGQIFTFHFVVNGKKKS